MDEKELFFWIVCLLFAAKLLWNLSLPYFAIFSLLRDPNREKVSTSPMPVVEFALLVILIAVSSPVHEKYNLTYVTTAAYGLGAIVASYLHLFVVSFVVLGILSLFRGTQSNVPHDD